MNYAAWKFWIDALVLIVVAGNWLYTWRSNREKVTTARFEELEKAVAKRVTREELEEAKVKRDGKCDTHQHETKKLESSYNALQLEVGKLPSRTEIKELSDSMRTLTEKIGNLDGRMSGVNRAVDLINEFLIDQGGKK